MLSYDITISISYRRTSSLISSPYSVIVCKFMHCFEIIFCFFLFASELLLLLLCDLSCQLRFVFIFPELFLNKIFSLNLTLLGYGRHTHPDFRLNSISGTLWQILTKLVLLLLIRDFDWFLFIILLWRVSFKIGPFGGLKLLFEIQFGWCSIL